MAMNMVGWFEIPVADMDRAIKFYSTVLEVQFEKVNVASVDMAMFPASEGAPGAGGALVFSEDFYQPSTSGTLVYFSSPSGDLENEFSRIEAAGGQLVVPKTSIGDHGFMAIFNDTEGNRVALHSLQ